MLISTMMFIYLFAGNFILCEINARRIKITLLVGMLDKSGDSFAFSLTYNCKFSYGTAAKSSSCIKQNKSKS